MRGRHVLEMVNMVERGHFLLSSGLHSPVYVQVARLLQHPGPSGRACAALARPFAGRAIDVVAGPAVGAVIIAYEVARRIGARAVWTERVDGRMALRRSFTVSPGERALVVEDVITTGGTLLEVRDVLTAAGAEVVAFAAVVDRRGADFLAGVPVHALVRMPLETYEAGACPLCAAGVPLVKPGSRPGASL
jgi:orotate phosphoribosyltransferase